MVFGMITLINKRDADWLLQGIPFLRKYREILERIEEMREV
jgi:hypothetical protein